MEPSIGPDGAYPRVGHNVSRRFAAPVGGGSLDWTITYGVAN